MEFHRQQRCAGTALPQSLQVVETCARDLTLTNAGSEKEKERRLLLARSASSVWGSYLVILASGLNALVGGDSIGSFGVIISSFYFSALAILRCPSRSRNDKSDRLRELLHYFHVPLSRILQLIAIPWIYQRPPRFTPSTLIVNKFEWLFNIKKLREWSMSSEAEALLSMNGVFPSILTFLDNGTLYLRLFWQHLGGSLMQARTRAFVSSPLLTC